MRSPVLFAMVGVGVAFAGLLGSPRSATAQFRPWCVVYQDKSGATSCYYDSFAQCLYVARGGNTGFCSQNPAYHEPLRPVVTQRHRHLR